MTLTLPQSLGGIKSYDSLGNVILRSTADQVEIYVDLVVDGTVHIHGDPSMLIDGTVEIGGNVEITGTTSLGGVLTMAADIEAAGFRITGGEFSTEADGMILVGDQINFGSGRTLGSGPGYIYLSAADVQIGALLSVSGDVHASNFIPHTVPTVSGSRGGNAALASLLTALDGLGLINDSSSA